MEDNAFTSLATVRLPSTCRLLASACCPDKDLVVLTSRLGNKDRMSLWKMQGSKIWEVDIASEENTREEIAGLAWSPDGQIIAVAHDPPRITLHSIQDGREERALSMFAVASTQRPYQITGIWWFKEEKPTGRTLIPDIFRRDNVITGTAHSILRTLPLLDNLQEDAQKLTVTDLFAFQGSQTRTAPKSSVPDMIRSWPTLHPDPLAASISAALLGQTQGSLGEVVDAVDDSSVNSVLAVADDLGHIHSFLDGHYPLGAITVQGGASILSLSKEPRRPTLYAHPRTSRNEIPVTSLWPITIELPLLADRKARDFAKLSSSCRELVWYTMRVVKEMRATWFGSESFTGARELGPRWTRALESKQKEQFGQQEPNSILDLTCLLLTGRATEPLLDFLGSGEQTSERGIQKWESTVTEALVKLRDFAEKRVAPACQRLHLILEEVEGWSQLPQYALFSLPVADIKYCLELTSRAIILASWLANIARRELARFKEFISWIRFETVIANPTQENHPVPRHDILEVNSYLMSGLVVSSIDKWFMGPIPGFSSNDLGISGRNLDISAVIDKARAVAGDPKQMAWHLDVKQKDLSHLDRNLDALIQELATRCQRVFFRAASATARSAGISVDVSSGSSQEASAWPALPNHCPSIRERIIKEGNERDEYLQYLVAQITSTDGSFLCLSQIRYGRSASGPSHHIGFALLECRLPGSSEEPPVDIDLLEAEFFDDELLVVIYKLRNKGDSTFIATVGYHDLGYEELQSGGYVKVAAREDLMLGAMQEWKEGHLPSVRMPIKRQRVLAGCKSGPVSLAVNGRAGRRSVCVLDSTGSMLEALDLEGDGEDEEGEDPEADGEI